MPEGTHPMTMSSNVTVVATSDVGDTLVNPVTSVKPAEGLLTTRGYIVLGHLDDEPDTATSASSWVEPNESSNTEIYNNTLY
jgi:hypothetical protein